VSYKLLSALRSAEALIAAYQLAYRDKKTATCFTKHSAGVFMTRAREDLLAYRPQAERFSRERSRAAKPLVPRS
jgi:hypothetical protein